MPISSRYDEIVSILDTDPIAQELLSARIPMRLAYVATDGSPRVIPISYLWDGGHFIINTPPGWAKIRAFEKEPRVSFVVDDSSFFPPHVMLVRGTVSKMEHLQGLQDDYVKASYRLVGDEHWDAWLEGVKTTITEQVRIEIRPTWLKVIDFVRDYPTGREGSGE